MDIDTELLEKVVYKVEKYVSMNVRRIPISYRSKFILCYSLSEFLS